MAVRKELLAVESGGNGASSHMLKMIFSFFVNSGEHDFFIKRLKNIALAYTPSQFGNTKTSATSNIYSDQPFEETTQLAALARTAMSTQPDVDYPEPQSHMA